MSELTDSLPPIIPAFALTNSIIHIENKDNSENKKVIY